MPSSKYRVHLLSIAEQDLTELISYLAAENPSAAAETLERIESRLQSVAIHPFAGRVPRDPQLIALGYRVLVIDNYLVFYKVKGATLLVYRILHGARDIYHLLYE
ncbi:MAG: type II toxin-antitoxin system RelE/ParE family toxin [Nitrospira sp.]|nr:type II toxin-antitoxin system RelE/ParE family toxin [Nitrospira sp.]